MLIHHREPSTTKVVNSQETRSKHWEASCPIALSRCEWRSRRIWECPQSPCTWMMQRLRSLTNFTKCRSKRRSRPASRQNLSRPLSAMRCGLPFRLCSLCCRSSWSFSKRRLWMLATCPTCWTTVR